MKWGKKTTAGFLALGMTVLAGCVEVDSTRPGWNDDQGERWRARYACQERIRDKIHRDRPKVERVRFQETHAWRGSRNRIRVGGEGRFLHRKNGWKHFHFKCEYSLDRDRIVTASYHKDEKGAGHRGSGGQGGGAAGDGRSRAACRKALSRRIKDWHPHATAIAWREDTLKVARLSGNRLRYSGKGKYRGGKGKRRSFDFRCVYDVGRGRVAKLHVDIH